MYRPLRGDHCPCLCIHRTLVLCNRPHHSTTESSTDLHSLRLLSRIDNHLHFLCLQQDKLHPLMLGIECFSPCSSTRFRLLRGDHSSCLCIHHKVVLCNMPHHSTKETSTDLPSIRLHFHTDNFLHFLCLQQDKLRHLSWVVYVFCDTFQYWKGDIWSIHIIRYGIKMYTFFMILIAFISIIVIVIGFNPLAIPYIITLQQLQY